MQDASLDFYHRTDYHSPIPTVIINNGDFVNSLGADDGYFSGYFNTQLDKEALQRNIT